jgi:hypothetical protein
MRHTIIKYRNITDNALAIGDIKFTRAPISEKVGNEAKILPKRRYKGAPGGCGTPNIIDDAINSPQSQKEVVGAIVNIYMNNGIRNARIPSTLLIFL